MLILKVKLTEQAIRLEKENDNLNFLPTRGTVKSAGIDLKACLEKDNILLPGESILIGSGVCFDFESLEEDGQYLKNDILVYGLVVPRSSVGFAGLVLANTCGIIDQDYRGEVMMKFINTSTVPYIIKPGQRLAQLILNITIPILKFIQIEEFDNVTERNDSGFGSTGEI